MYRGIWCVLYLSELRIWISEFGDCFWRVVLLVHGFEKTRQSKRVDQRRERLSARSNEIGNDLVVYIYGVLAD